MRVFLDISIAHSTTMCSRAWLCVNMAMNISYMALSSAAIRLLCSLLSLTDTYTRNRMNITDNTCANIRVIPS